MLARIPLDVLHDSGTLIAAWTEEITQGSRQGTFVQVPFSPPDHGPRAAAKRALTISAISISPNSIVIGIDRHRKFLLLHQAAARPKPALIRKLEAA